MLETTPAAKVPAVKPEPAAAKRTEGATKRVGADRGEHTHRAVAQPEHRLEHRQARTERDDRTGVQVGRHAGEGGPFPLLAGIAIAILNLTLRPLLKMLFLPINLITLGIFGWMLDLFVLYVALWLVPGFQVGQPDAKRRFERML